MSDATFDQLFGIFYLLGGAAFVLAALMDRRARKDTEFLVKLVFGFVMLGFAIFSFW